MRGHDQTWVLLSNAEWGLVQRALAAGGLSLDVMADHGGTWCYQVEAKVQDQVAAEPLHVGLVSVRTRNILWREDVRGVAALAALTWEQVVDWRLVGGKALIEVIELRQHHGVHDTQQWVR